MSKPKVITRAAAKSRGLMKYYTGKPCPHGHVTERRVSNRECVVCHRAAVHRRSAKARAEGRKWDQRHPVEMAETHALSRARYRCRALGLPDPLPKGYDRARLVAFYARVVAVRQSGIRVDADHRTPLALGGSHTVSNLQILTLAQHRAKTKRDLARIAAARRAA